MAGYNFGHRNQGRRLPRRVLFLVVILVLGALVGVGVVRQVYSNGLKPVSNDQTSQLVKVEQGSSVKDIADNLQTKKLIRSSWAMQRYVQSKLVDDKLQAGTYAFAPSQSTQEIVGTLTKGRVSTRLVTILPGRRIDQVRADLINDGFVPAEVDQALDPAQYTDVPVLSFKPENIKSLEGLLWPDSYQKDDATKPADIIRASLNAMGERLTPSIQSAFAAKGLATYQGLILTSIVTQEVNSPQDQAQAAQVFLKRLSTDRALESDVTAKYGAVLAGKAPNVTFTSAYNTYQNKGLPPGPVSTITGSALRAVSLPAATDWLYFVAGDDGKTYFSNTLEEHEALTDKHCTKLCGN